MSTESKQSVVGIFREVSAFERALDGLLKAGFQASAISVLGSHQKIIEQFGQIPRPNELTDDPDTPRESLETESALHKAVDFIAGTLAVISEFGAAAAAFAIGGPVGVAAASADLTDISVDIRYTRSSACHYRSMLVRGAQQRRLSCRQWSWGMDHLHRRCFFRRDGLSAVFLMCGACERLRSKG
jgi:hypothetical protein